MTATHTEDSLLGNRKTLLNNDKASYKRQEAGKGQIYKKRQSYEKRWRLLFIYFFRRKQELYNLATRYSRLWCYLFSKMTNASYEPQQRCFNKIPKKMINRRTINLYIVEKQKKQQTFLFSPKINWFIHKKMKIILYIVEEHDNIYHEK